MSAVEHKIIWMFSTPRSRSTAMVRYMQSRGDFQIFNEPFQLAYGMNHSHPTVRSWYNESACQTYEEGLDRIFEAAKRGNVFVKDMSFTFKDFLASDQSDRLLSRKNVYIILLLRHPHHSIVSCYKEIGEVEFEQIKDTVPNALGYDTVYDAVIESYTRATNPIHLLQSEELCHNAEGILLDLCLHLGLNFNSEHLEWKDLGDSFDGVEEWHEIKPLDGVYRWHRDAIHSKSFLGTKTYKVDREGRPTLEEISNLEHRQLIHDLVKKSMAEYIYILKFFDIVV